MFDTVIITKPDLDTCLTALILGVDSQKMVQVKLNGASPEDLKNPRILCIEAGGSSLVRLNNFDHHDPQVELPPACQQALEQRPQKDADLVRLVNYVCCIDENRPLPKVAFPTLSGLFSGMRLYEKDYAVQFSRGFDLLQQILREHIDPFKTLPYRAEWSGYVEAKREDSIKKQQYLKTATFFTTKTGLKVGCLNIPPGEKGAIGGFNALYSMGCNIGLLSHTQMGEPPVKKMTIASQTHAVSHLLPQLNQLEPGWGGRRTIIGSPFAGTNLSCQTLSALIEGSL